MRQNVPFRLLGLLLGCLFVFSSCRKEQENENYMHALPSDVSMVLSLNLENLAQKADLSTLITPEMTANMISSLQKGAKAETSLLMEKIVKDPTELGWDLSKEMFVFVNAKKNSVGFLSAIKDETKVRSWVDALKKEGAVEEIKSGDVTVLSEKRTGAVCAFSKIAFLFLGGSNPVMAAGTLQSDAEILLKQTGDAGLFANESFQYFLSERHDMNVWFSLANYPDELTALYKSMFPDMDMSSIVYNGYIQFEKGNIEIKGRNVVTDPETEKLLKKYNEQITGKMSGKFLNNMPDNMWLSMGGHVKNGKVMMEMIGKSPIMKQYLALVTKGDMNIDIEKLISSLNGDILLGVAQPAEKTLLVPNIVLCMQASDNSLAEVVKTLFETKSIPYEQISPNNYKFSIPGIDLKVYWGYRNGVFYAMNDDAVYTAFIEGTAANSAFTGSAEANMFKDSYSAFLFDMPRFIDAFQEILLSKAAPILPVLSKIQRIEAVQDNTMESVANIRLTDDSENSLKVLISLIIQQVNAQK